MSSRQSRPTKETVERRVEEVLRIILDGAEPGWDLCEFVREREAEEGSAWHLTDGEKPLSYSQIRRYAAKAEKLIGESCRASRKRLLRRHLARRRNLYAKAISQGDIRAALACLDSEARLCGLFEDEMTRQLDRLEKEIAELKVQYGHSNPPSPHQADASGPALPPADGTAAAPRSHTP